MVQFKCRLYEKNILQNNYGSSKIKDLKQYVMITYIMKKYNQYFNGDIYDKQCNIYVVYLYFTN